MYKQSDGQQFFITDERSAFDEWVKPTLRPGSHLMRSRVNDVYTDNRVAAKWSAWQMQ